MNDEEAIRIFLEGVASGMIETRVVDGVTQYRLRNTESAETPVRHEANESGVK